eukprot:771688-Rhodomonas_salina.1
MPPPGCHGSDGPPGLIEGGQPEPTGTTTTTTTSKDSEGNFGRKPQPEAEGEEGREGKEGPRRVGGPGVRGSIVYSPD